MDKNTEEQQPEEESSQYDFNHYIGAGMAFGIGAGVAIGVALDKIGLGIAIGVALGPGFAALIAARKKKK